MRLLNKFFSRDSERNLCGSNLRTIDLCLGKFVGRSKGVLVVKIWAAGLRGLGAGIESFLVTKTTIFALGLG